MHSHQLRQSLRAGAIGIGGLLLAVAEASTPNDAIAMFDGICVNTRADLTLIEKIAKASKASPVSPDMAKLDPAIAEKGGKGFVFVREGTKYVVIVAKNGGCSVMAARVSWSAIQQALVANYPLGAPQQDASGTQTLTLWPIIAPSSHKGGVIMLNVPKPGFRMDDAVFIGYVPAALVRKLESPTR